MLGGREEGAGWWDWEHYSGREEDGVLDGPVGDWRPDLINKSAENNSLDLNMEGEDADLLAAPKEPKVGSASVSGARATLKKMQVTEFRPCWPPDAFFFGGGVICGWKAIKVWKLGPSNGTGMKYRPKPHYLSMSSEKSRVFQNPLFGEPVVWTPDSRGFRHFRGFRDFRESSTQLVLCNSPSCLRCFHYS